MEDNDHIIVFRQYENSIDANIAKSKLDAYGIPCFLTEENMSNLYPGPNMFAIKVRLHLFDYDKERADQILKEGNLSIDREVTTTCPNCHSTRLERTFPKKSADSIKYLFFGVFFPDEKINHCMDCDTEF
jgi:hypothetical protein